VVLGLAGDLCPDHFYVSNVEEIITWAKEEQADIVMDRVAMTAHHIPYFIEQFPVFLKY
jgi:hypothetical protein